MPEALTVDRWQFAFTVSFHYLFPQLTMGLALLLVAMKLASRGGRVPRWDGAARFWGRIFAVNFVAGVVTGIPMEMEFGTNWSAFSRYAGGVIGQPLAMEGLFAFFLESTFLGLFLYGERKLGRRGHLAAAVLVFLGTWLSGYFILATDAFLQHPSGHAATASGTLALASLSALLGNPWLPWQYLHTMSAAVMTASFAVAAVGAFYLLSERHAPFGRDFVRLGVVAALCASLFQLFPSGDGQGRAVARWQPATLAAMEGAFHTQSGAPLVLVGQPDMEKLALDNPLVIPRALSFLTWRRWTATVQGLTAFPRSDWPDNVPLVYFSYHIMVGLGTLLLLLAFLAAVQLPGGRLFGSRATLWALLFAFPFPYIATTAGWMTAELGRQPWLVYGLFRTASGASPAVSSGNVLFTLLGWCGLYVVVAALVAFLIGREVLHGPAEPAGGGEA